VNWLDGSTAWVYYLDEIDQLRELKLGLNDYWGQLFLNISLASQNFSNQLPATNESIPSGEQYHFFSGTRQKLQTPLGQIESTCTLDTSTPISSGWFLDTVGPAFHLIASLFIGVVLYFANAVTSWLLPWLALTAQLPFEANHSLYHLNRAGFLVTRLTDAPDYRLELLWVVSLGLVVAMTTLWTDPFLTVVAPMLTVSLIALVTRYRGTIQRVLFGCALLSCFKATDTFTSVPLQVDNGSEMKASQLVVNTENLCWWSNAAQEVRKSRREWAYSLIAQLSMVFVVQAFLAIGYLTYSTDTKNTTISVGLALNNLWIWAIPGWVAMRHMSHSRVRSTQNWSLGTKSTSAEIIDILRPFAQRIIQSFGSIIGCTALANPIFHKIVEFTSNTWILYTGPGTEDGSNFASLFLNGPWSNKELMNFEFTPQWLQRNHCLAKDQDLLIPDRTILQSMRDDDSSVSAVSPENKHVRFKNTDGEEAGPKCVASILGLPSAISILSNLTDSGLYILATTCGVLGAVMTIALRSATDFYGSNVITDPFSPSRNEAASNIYVVPESYSLSIGAATGLAAACCIPAVLWLVSTWNIILGNNWKSRDGGVSGSVFSSLLIPYTDIFRPDIQTRSWKSRKSVVSAVGWNCDPNQKCDLDDSLGIPRPL
jgi:hypothetical protein